MEFVFSRSSEKQSKAHPPLDTEGGSKGPRKHFTNERLGAQGLPKAWKSWQSKGQYPWNPSPKAVNSVLSQSGRLRLQDQAVL